MSKDCKYCHNGKVNKAMYGQTEFALIINERTATVRLVIIDGYYKLQTCSEEYEWGDVNNCPMCGRVLSND